MELRDIIIWLGLIAIVAIVWDGLRRMKAAKPKKTTVAAEDDYVDPEEAARKAQIARELPNGGARIRTMTDEEQHELKSKLNLRERVPMLMERVEVAEPEVSEPEVERDTQLQSELDFSAAMSEPHFSAYDDDAEGEQAVDVSDPRATDREQPVSVAVDKADSDSVFEADELDESDELDAEMAEQYVPAEDSDLQDTEPYSQSEVRHDAGQKANEPEPEVQELGPVEDLVIVHVMAHDDEELSGSLLLDLLITAGLRHGPMDIFHYRNPRGITEFSLANCVQPGTFDPDAMNQVNTPGVTLFMQLPTAANALESFDHMIEMAQFLAKHLQAQILDEDHSTVTPQRIEYYREKIRSFERSKLIPS